MRLYYISFCILLALSINFNSCTSSQGLSSVQFQENLKEEWNNPKTTPLQEDEIDDFKGISFFPINKKYIVKAKFIKIKNGSTIPFPTSAKKIKHYKEYGKVEFQIEGVPFELTIYQSYPPIQGHENSLFLPFTDETNGISSYGGGRYIDINISDIKNNKLVLDFNKAYNPYCAYSKYYNCPIPPANNHLKTEIKAGVSYLE